MQGQSESRDTTFVGPGLANTIRQCDGLVQQMSFWTFDDVFEEGGPIAKPFEGNFGLRAEFGINKPSFYDFALLHQLGDERVANPADDVLVTRNPDGSLTLAAWNIVDPAPDSQPPTAPNAPSKTLTFRFAGVAANAAVTISQVNNEHGNVLPLYARMGSPRLPTPEQVKALNSATALPPAEETHLTDSTLKLTLEPNALALIHIAAH